jgi:hypothetical protein
MDDWQERPVGNLTGGMAFSIRMSDMRSSATAADAPKPKQPFLRRNTGLQKRIFDAQVKRCARIIRQSLSATSD